MKKLTIIVLITFGLYKIGISQNTISMEEKDSIIVKIKTLIKENYVFEDKVDFINKSLDDLYKIKYDSIERYGQFAGELTKDLREISNDKHFRVNYNPSFIKMILSEPEETAEEEIEWEKEQGLKENFGFEKLEILEGNIGYLRFNFFYPLELVKNTIDASMEFLKYTDGIIIDLRDNQGGYNPTDNYLASYFFDNNPIYWSSTFDKPANKVTNDSTFYEIPKTDLEDKPVYILISSNTVSNGEKFSYCMKHLERATLVGTKTYGAANGSDFLILNQNYGIQVPVSNITIPTTNENWESVGVEPDIESKKENSFDIAYIEILNNLIGNSDNPEQIKKYNDIKIKLNNR